MRRGGSPSWSPALPSLSNLRRTGTRTAAGGHYGVPTTLTAPEVLASMYPAC